MPAGCGRRFGHLGGAALDVGAATLHQMPLRLRWSGACLVLLMLGWPLAVLTLLAVGVITWLLSPSLSVPATLALTVWHGLVPATLAMGWGHCLRRFLGTKVFVYLFGRGFFGTVVCLFIAGLLAQAMPTSNCPVCSKSWQDCPLADGLGRCGGDGDADRRLCGLPSAVVGHLVERFVPAPAAAENKI